MRYGGRGRSSEHSCFIVSLLGSSITDLPLYLRCGDAARARMQREDIHSGFGGAPSKKISWQQIRQP